MAEKTQSVALARRRALCSGGAVAFGTLLAALLGGRTAARVQTLGGAVPEVEVSKR
jgi:hypothetical protein